MSGGGKGRVQGRGGFLGGSGYDEHSASFGVFVYCSWGVDFVVLLDRGLQNVYLYGGI